MKEGIKTTEFWLSLFLIIILVGFSIFIVLHNPKIESYVYSGLLMSLAWLKTHSYCLNRVKQKLEESHALQFIGDKLPWLKEHLPFLFPCTPVSPVQVTPVSPSIIVTEPPKIKNKERISASLKITPKTTIMRINDNQEDL